jgi:hypothetical protein
MLWSQYKLATMRCSEFLCKQITGIPNFCKSEFQFSDFPDIGISKKTGIFGIKNGIGIPLLLGVPEIRTKNWNSQPSLASYILWMCPLLWQDHFTLHKKGMTPIRDGIKLAL